MDAKEALERLDASTRRYRRTEAAHEESRKASIADVLAALRAGARPTDVANRSPFTDTYVRRIARDNGLAPRRKGGRFGRHKDLKHLRTGQMEHFCTLSDLR
jgi:hypothetical protein